MDADDRDAPLLAEQSRDALLRRSAVYEAFFAAEAARLAAACQEMSRRFLAGGRLLAFGGDPASATDAAHVAVEFVHPVIMGKRALPALDLSADFAQRLPVLVRPHDMVMGFAFPSPNAAVDRALAGARAQGALTFALTGDSGTSTADYAFPAPDADPFLCQECFEILYHVLWETVHVYFEHREQGHDVGASAFLYPMLGRSEQALGSVVAEVQNSLRQKVAEGNRLRAAAADTEAAPLVGISREIVARLERGGTLIAFGNGGSATDANDLAADCVTPPEGYSPLPALSLAAESAPLTAIANDIGSEAIFARQLIAHARPEDVAIAISASGSSANLLSALAEARKRGLLTVGIVGYDGGKIVKERLVDRALVVRSDYVPRIQEVQASLYHVLRRRIEGLRRRG